MNLNVLVAAGGIALVDIVLSGDNALVIGAAASKLPRSQRLIAIIWGGVGAVLLRLALAIAATELLTVKYLQAAGGIVLFIITIRLLLPERESRHARPPADRFLNAIVIIMVADVTMSLDNVLAVGALAAGNIPLLVAGLILSMALLFVASTLIARLMDRFKWLLDVAALILGWTAANLILGDSAVLALMGPMRQPNIILALHLSALALVIVIDLFIRAIVAHRAGRLVSLSQQITSAEPVSTSEISSANHGLPDTATPPESSTTDQSQQIHTP